MIVSTLQEFKIRSNQMFTSGVWSVQYHDRTHLPEDKWIAIAEVYIEEFLPHAFSFVPRQARSVPVVTESQQSDQNTLEAQLQDAWKTKRGDELKRPLERTPDYILDQICSGLVRLGVLTPTFEIDDAEFQNRKFAVIVMDTNSLRNGCIRHLLEQFQNVSFWIVVPQVALMEIGERMAYDANKGRGDWKPSNWDFIRTRPQSTIAPQEVMWIQNCLPHEILELTPELFRTFRGFESNKDKDTDPDRFSINDRLILEGIKDLRRQRGLSEEVYLMTGDKGMSRMARLEGIRTIFPLVSGMDQVGKGIYSLRYSHWANKFYTCSLQRLLWDLTQTFHQIRIECDEGLQKGQSFELVEYDSKVIKDWSKCKLQVKYIGSSASSSDS